MIWLLLLAAAAGAFVWLGRRGTRNGGDWRAAAAVLAAAAGLGAIVAVAKGAYVLAASLAAVAAFVLAAGRRTPAGLSDMEARALLGVGPDATPEQIRAAHRALIRTAHPDRGGSPDAAARLNAARDRLLRG